MLGEPGYHQFIRCREAAHHSTDFWPLILMDSLAPDMLKQSQTSISRFTYITGIKANYLMTGITGETGSDMMHLISIPSCTEFIPAVSIQP